MWSYDKKLQFPVNIKNPNPEIARFIISQYGGPDGEIGASLRYLSQRYSMDSDIARGLLTDVGTEEMGHFEMVGAMVHQLTRNLTPDEIRRGGFSEYYVDHGVGVYAQGASGMPFNAAAFAVKGDVIADLTEDLAAEQKARATYEKMLNLITDPDVREPLKFLRAREIVHFQRFGEALRTVQENRAVKTAHFMPKPQ